VKKQTKKTAGKQEFPQKKKGGVDFHADLPSKQMDLINNPAKKKIIG
jgi:hypothetical protein